MAEWVPTASNKNHPAQPPASSGWRRTLAGFWLKINRDWMFNLSSMLAYNFLLSAFPLLLLSISLLGLVFAQEPSACSLHRTEGQLINSLISILPRQLTVAASGTRGAEITALCAQLSHETFPLACVGVVAGLWFGSRLFVKMENAFGVIFRLRSRSFWRQNGLAVGMAALFAVLGPLSVMLSVAPAHLLGLARRTASTASLPGYIIGSIGGTLVAFLLIALIYMIVPNEHIRFRDVWRGALVAAVLLDAYEVLFPLYARFIGSNTSYGAIAGLLVILLLFFYYFAVILLLGAEMNSWSHGHQETAGDIATMLAQATSESRV